MSTPLSQKSTLAEIEQRFDHDVDRFSNLDTGQVATIDAPLAMELITAAALAATPVVTRILDIGCGAGNNTIKLLRCHGGSFDCDLNDLSMPMLIRAQQRVGRETSGRVNIFQGDFRTAPFAGEGYDIILAAAVLHHLRDEQDWLAAFARIHSLLRPKGSFWVTDLVSHEIEPVQRLMWRRYGDYLEATGGEAYREKVVRYIDREDSPRPITFQLDLMRRVGFRSVDLLHKNSCFAAFGGVRE
ncbi:class I SAM-dependent methyltransferase [Desulfobulbus sp.]|uniref:class I SAM-dependent methyltransferase n=1 Tax=Desulfobulbus sp. TaxID=895 RepID=UPI00286EC039|nr:class I SAM-dependent methyltransferase [Desulfobulbus sp.]